MFQFNASTPMNSICENYLNNEKKENVDNFLLVNSDITKNEVDDVIDDVPDDEENVQVEEEKKVDESDDMFKTRLHIMMIDDIPYFYEQDINVAKAKLFLLANKLRKTFSSDDDFEEDNFSIIYKSPEEIQVVSIIDLFFFKYHKVLHTLKLDYVCQMDDESLNF